MSAPFDLGDEKSWAILPGLKTDALEDGECSVLALCGVTADVTPEVDGEPADGELR